MVTVIGSVIIAMSALLAVVYNRISQTLLDKSEEVLRTTADITLQETRAWMNRTLTMLEAQRDTIEYENMSIPEMTEYIKHTAGKNDAYFDEDSRSYVVGASGVLKDARGAVRGVAAADVYLDSISEIVSNFQAVANFTRSGKRRADMELAIDRVSKQYKSKIAVDSISLRLHKGIHGMLGENGAGKTTLMRMICGVLRPTSGTISFDGIDVSKEAYRSVLGYLPQDFGYYPDFTGMDFLLYMAALKGMEKPQAKRKAGELLQLVSLQEAAGKKIKTYSGGMKQRLGIAQALLNEPKLLILDEPTAGLDPKERAHFRSIIQDWGKNNIVLLSTHIVSDIEHIADDILILKGGQLIYCGKWDGTRGGLEEFYLQQFDNEDG